MPNDKTAAKGASFNPLDWRSSKLRSQRSLGILRSRVTNLRSPKSSRADSDSNSSPENKYHDLSGADIPDIPRAERPTDINTIAYDQQDSAIEKHLADLQVVASFLGEDSRENDSTSYNSDTSTEEPTPRKPAEYVMRPPSVISQTLSVNLASQTGRRPSTRNSVREANYQPRTSFSHSSDSERSSMTKFTDNKSSSRPTVDGAAPSSAIKQNGNDLPPLQIQSVLEDTDQLDPILEDDPSSFDLVQSETKDDSIGLYSLERRADEMFSNRHLEQIFTDPSALLKFTGFLSKYRQSSIPVLLHHLDAVKALKAIKYANSIVSCSLVSIPGYDFTKSKIDPLVNEVLEKRAKESFNALVREELPAYIAHVFVQVVGMTLRQKVTGLMPAHLQEASEGLAEVFCLTDPSRPDHPIIFASEEFHRTTQYGVEYAIGRNCRFLQGPHTSKDSVRRLSEAIHQGREINELFLNYRRDGSPFMNLLTISPLYDSKGKLRYFIGAQVDVSGLCKDATNLEGLRQLLKHKKMNSQTSQMNDNTTASEHANGTIAKDSQEVEYKNEVEESGNVIDNAFQELSEMFTETEMDIARTYGGRAHNLQAGEKGNGVRPTFANAGPRTYVRESSDGEQKEAAITSPSIRRNPYIGLFQHYLLVRPFPSLRILFASDALRTPGILQSPFLSRIGGSSRVRAELSAALAAGRGVTAKVRWISGQSSADSGGSRRWVHCTPLLGRNGSIGVWMIVIVDEEGYEPARRFKAAPPVAWDVRRLSKAPAAWELSDDEEGSVSFDREKTSLH